NKGCGKNRFRQGVGGTSPLGGGWRNSPRRFVYRILASGFKKVAIDHVRPHNPGCGLLIPGNGEDTPMLGRIALAGSLILTATTMAQVENKAGKKAKPAPVISWKKTVVDRAFRSEGVAVADVNKDGKMDIIVGDVWYEAPDWKMHVIRKGDKYQEKGYNPLGYSQSFAVFAEDIN